MHLTAARLACLLLLSFAAATAQAEKVYRWTDASGKVHFSDRPQSGNARPIEVKPGSGPGGAASDKVNASDAAECERRSAQLDTYRRAERIVEKDGLGREREYSAGERDKLLQLTEQAATAACADLPS